MTLYRQLLLVILFIFGALIAGVFSIEISNTKDYLSEQQQTNVNNAATSLGLSLIPYLESEDEIGAESVINAMFDSGHYQQISLYWLDSKSPIERINTSHVIGVPEWFIQLDLFQQPQHQQTLTSGWMQLAELKVVSHPGYAYLQLWSAMVNLATTFGVGFLITILIMIQALRRILRPIHQIKEQADKVGQRNFGQHLPMPYSLELRSVVKAINSMSDNLAEQFANQVKEAGILRQRAFQDHTSGLGNRAYFTNQGKSWLAESGVGGVLLLSLDILPQLRLKDGYAACDDLLRALGEGIKLLDDQKNDLVFSRIANQEIAVLAIGYDEEGLNGLAIELTQLVHQCLGTSLQYMEKPVAIGMVLRLNDERLSELLSAADNALLQARELRDSNYYLAQFSRSGMSRSRWKSVLEDVLQRQSLSYKSQPICLIGDQQVYHHELFTTIEVDAQTYAAGQFMPAVEQLQLGTLFDKLVVEQAAQALESKASLFLAVNLTLSAIAEAEFILWFKGFITENSAIAERMAFEFPEAAFLNPKDELCELIDLLHDVGFQLGIDQYGRNLNSLSYLSWVKPHYVKIDYGYTAQALAEDGDSHFLSALCRTAKNLQIITIAQRVEDYQQVERLSELPIDAYQGYVHPPQPFFMNGK